MGHRLLILLPHLPTPPKSTISLRIMIKRVQKPGRFSYQRVKTGEGQEPQPKGMRQEKRNPSCRSDQTT